MAELRRILLVEDSQYDAELIVAALAENGFAHTIEIVRDGAALESFLQRTRSDLPAEGNLVGVLLDLHLPRSDSLEILTVIRKDRALRSIPVVMLASSREEQELAMSYGPVVSGFVEKPVDFQQFVRAIKQVGLLLGLID
jgi:CheY-like chemotaxis protein